MKAKCPICECPIKADRSKIPLKGARVKCPKCQHPFLLLRTPDPKQDFAVCPKCEAKIMKDHDECPQCGTDIAYFEKMRSEKDAAATEAEEKKALEEQAQDAITEKVELSKTLEVDVPKDPAMIKFLASAEIFKDVPGDDIEDISTMLGKKKVMEDAVVFKENEPGEKLYILQEGTVKISITPGEKQHDTESSQLLGPGEIFGEFSFVDGLNRSATARAQEDSTLLSMARESFDKLCKEKPATGLIITHNIARIITKKVRKTTQLLRASE